VSVDGTDAVADAILHEGYMLYPYRRSALKNQMRWTFGVLEPSAEPLHCECLVLGETSTRLSATLRWLEPLREAVEVRCLEAEPFALVEGDVQRSDRLALRLTRVNDAAHRLAVTVMNPGPHLVASAQVLLHLRAGEFVPPRDPPAHLRQAQDACTNRGLWPILLGRQGQLNRVLCSPIIVEDYPRIAPESPRNLFDGTEIDELLTLRIQTLTEAEQSEIARGDARVRELLDDVLSLEDQHLSSLHGARRGLHVGDRVRLRPRHRADIIDLALAGRLATIVAIEHDFEERTHLAVTIDDDPGQDLGKAGQPGHRFFFAPDELEPAD
jgi:hypothetical protein